MQPTKPATPTSGAQRKAADAFRPLRALVADANATSRADLTFRLNVDERIGEVISLADGSEILRTLHDHAVDVLFMDVTMGDVNGFEVATSVRPYSDAPAIVFVTNSGLHAVEAFRVQALDYLVRPLSDERLQDTLGRVADVRRGQPGHLNAAPIEDESIPVELGGVTRFIKRSDVRFVEAHGDYARLITGNNRHLIRVPLSVLEERWRAAGFVRIHRRYLVALAFIDEVRVDQGKASVVIGNVHLEISRRHTRELRDRLVRHARPRR